MELTQAQEWRLTGFEREGAKVIGWEGRGPIVRLPDGRERVVGPSGRLLSVAGAAKKRPRRRVAHEG